MKKIVKPEKSQQKHIEKPFVDKGGNKKVKKGKILNTTKDNSFKKGKKEPKKKWEK